VHPIVLERASRRGNEEILALFEKAVVAEVEVVPFAAVQEFVEKQSGGTCANRTPCLVALAKATGAKYVLFASIAPNGPKLQLEGRLVRADGKVVKEVLRLSADKPADWTREAAVEEAYRLLLSKLKLTTVPGIKKARPPEVEQPGAQAEPQKEPVKETPPVKVPVAEPVAPTRQPAVASPAPTTGSPVELTAPAARGSSALRTTGWVVAGVGVALGAGALAMGLLADKDAKALTPNENGWIPSSQVSTALAMRTKATAAVGLGVGAAVAVVTGLTCIVMGPSDKSVAVVPLSGGAMLVFSGAIP
jgi:hypothetical protein